MNVGESQIRSYTSRVKQYKDGISLAIGEPFIKIEESIINATIESLKASNCKYTNAQGDSELINSISNKEKVDTNNILVTNGSSEGIFISLLTILNKGDEVIVITPCYPQYEPVVSFCGAHVRYVHTSNTNFAPTRQSLDNVLNKKTRVLIINTPSNPTGVIYDSETLRIIDDFASKNKLIIICDDVYEDICFKDRSEYPFDLKYTIFTKSFSKSYGMTGYRLGYIITNDMFIKQLLKVHSYLCISLPPFIQKAGVEALKINNINRSDIYNNLNLICDFLKKENLSYINVDGGIFIMVNIEKYGLDSTTFCDKLLKDYHVACVPGSCFKAEGFIRINFAVNKLELIEGLSRISSFIKNLKEETL